LYGTEIAPQELRVHLIAVGIALHWLFSFAIAEAFSLHSQVLCTNTTSCTRALGFSFCPWYTPFLKQSEVLWRRWTGSFQSQKRCWQVASAAQRLVRSAIGDVEDMEEKAERFFHVEKA
jgi:hypothetical protein